MERPLKSLVTAYLATLIALVVIDFVWLSFMAERLYRPVMGDMLLSEFKLAPAVLFYLLYAAGTVFLAVRPGMAANSLVTALAHGAALGLAAYSTYDLTNQATLKNWSLTLTISDIMWGTCLTAVAAAFSLEIVRLLSRADIPGDRPR